MKTPQVDALPGMTPLGLPDLKIWNATAAWKTKTAQGIWIGPVRALNEVHAKRVATMIVKGNRRGTKIISMQVTLSGWNR